jgi:hypothetical protein
MATLALVVPFGLCGVSLGQLGLGSPADIARYFQAVSKGDAAAVTRYLQQGVPIEARNELGLTGLHLAAYQRQANVVEAILAALPPVAATLPTDRPLSFDEYLDSISFDRYQGDQKRGDVLNAKTPQAMTAIHLAIGALREEEEVYARIVAAILAAGADANVADGRGYTPLHKAAELGYAKVAKVLLERGADRSIRTGQGQAAADLARDPAVRSLLAPQTPVGNQPALDLLEAIGFPQPPADAGENRTRIVVIDANGQVREIEVQEGKPLGELNPAGMGTLPVSGAPPDQPVVGPAGSAKAYRLSPQQAAVHERLGFPDFFNILLIDEDLGTRVVSTRVEKWVYVRGGTVFAFCDGQCVGIKKCRPPKQLPRTVIQYTPIQFTAGMTQDDVRVLLGPNGCKRLSLGEAGFRTAELRDLEFWSDGTATLSFHRGRLVAVQAACRGLPKP